MNLNRRDLLLTALASSAAQKAAFAASPQSAGATGGLDRFGGWTAKRFQATGFFRVEKDDRWWLVTPEGNAFLSFGINHLAPDLWNQDYNRQAWKRKLSLESLEGPKFTPALKTWFLETCGGYGFNTVGVHSSLQVANHAKPSLPYMRPIRFVDIPHWRTEVPDENFLDVFSADFAQRCNRLAREFTAPNDPLLLGYSMTDCPLFTEEDCRTRPDTIGGARRPSRTGWPRRLRNLPGSALGKRAYVETVRDLYRDDVGEFNRTYSTDFRSFDALASAENWRPDTDLSNSGETRDNIEFLHRVVAKYYQTARDAIRRYDSNHLFFGDKVNANTDAMDTVLPIVSRYTDVVFYQMYGRYEVQQPSLDRWAQRVDKPVINGDSAFTMITDAMPRPYGPVADTLPERIDWTVEFFQNAFARPEFVGWHYCGLIDASNLVPRKQARQHSGLLDGYGEPYPGLKEAVKACADKMYRTASG